MDKQSQKAGDNAFQIQGQNVHIVTGITEERARYIYKELFDLSQRELKFYAEECALERIEKFEDKFYKKLSTVIDSHKLLLDPSFQFQLSKAQTVAACSERESDYEILVELLTSRPIASSDRKFSARINKSIEIIDQIDDDALSALTTCFNLSKVTVGCPKINEIIRSNQIFYNKASKNLPAQSMEWLDHLEMLGCIRISETTRMKTFEELIKDNFSKFLKLGVKKDSFEHEKILQILEKNKLPVGYLVDNDICDSYLRIFCDTLDDFSTIIISDSLEDKSFTEAEARAIQEIISLYSKNEKAYDYLIKESVQIFLDDEKMKGLSEWFDRMPCSFQLRSLGEMIAFANNSRLN